VPRYVERGESAILQCRHNVQPEILFKVSAFYGLILFLSFLANCGELSLLKKDST